MITPPDSPTVVDSALETAQAAFARADWPAAVEALREALQSSPQDSSLLILLGHARLNAGDLPGALSAYQDCARLAPKQSVVHACTGLVLQLLKRTAEATEAIGRALAIDAHDVIALKVKARIAIDAGDAPVAVATCQTLLRLQPDDADVKRLADDCLSLPIARKATGRSATSRVLASVNPQDLFGDYAARTRAWGELGSEHLSRQWIVDDIAPAVEIVRVPASAGIADDGLPIPPVSLTMGYGAGDLAHYIRCGQTSHAALTRILRDRRVTLGAGDALLDWGCASGRVVRNFALLAAAGCEVWGGDVHAPSIRWAQKNLSPTIRFFNSTTLPKLPFADGTFKFIYGLSVFTHLNALRDVWLLELRRVLAPDGILVLTVHNEDTWRWFHAKGMPDWMPPALRRQSAFPGDCVEIRGSRWEHCYTLFSDDYLRRTWGPYFGSLEILPCVESYQSAVVLRKAPARS